MAGRPAELIEDLRADLRASGWTVDAVEETLGAAASAALHREQPLLADRVTAALLSSGTHDEGDPGDEGDTGIDPERARTVATLVRCFVLGLPVPAGALADALPRTGVDGLLGLGLAERSDGLVRATCDLRPYGTEQDTWWVTSDTGELATGQPLATDHVLGVGGASTTLASWTPRPQVDKALDIGTGCGVQVLHLAGHTRHRTATDLSARALDHAALALALNGVEAELLRGSLLEPVAGRRFDLVVSNPPFVITPRTPGVPCYEYRDGGRAGDALVAGLVADLADHLEPGGIAQLLANWELAPGEDWRDHVSAWLRAPSRSGSADTLDAWVVQREVQDVAEYAETWIRDGGHRPGTPAHRELYEAWLADFETRGIDRVGFGVITLQRPATDRAPWRDLCEVPHPVASPMGPTVLEGLRARTWLAEHDEDALLDTPWQVAPDVTEERVGAPGAPDPQVIVLRQGGGLRRAHRLSSLVAGFVGACDGELTARQLCSGLAVLTEADPADVVAEVVPVLRDLVADGFVR